jgi:hypothetical protein
MTVAPQYENPLPGKPALTVQAYQVSGAKLDFSVVANHTRPEHSFLLYRNGTLIAEVPSRDLADGYAGTYIDKFVVDQYSYKVCFRYSLPATQVCGDFVPGPAPTVVAKADPGKLTLTKPKLEPIPGMIKPAPRRDLDLLAPEAAVAMSFSGVWLVTSDKPWGYRMSLRQSGSLVTGSYTVDVNGVAGRISGTVSGRVLTFSWDQDGGYTGDGRITIAGNGQSFAGSYRVNDNGTLTPDLLQGRWAGVRQ